MSPTPDPRAIRELAYRLWEEQGRENGSAESHWLEAERQLTRVHEEFTRSATRSPNATGTSASPTAQRDPSPEYTPEHPPVNAEFKWAAAELNGSTRR
jgi:hypothetical protein